MGQPASPFSRRIPRGSVTKIMLQVLLALIPGCIAMIWWFGWGVLVNIIIAVLVCVFAEALVLAIRGKAVNTYLTDLSAIVTAVLLALALPPLAPWWMTAVGSAFAIVVAKHLYGGLGYNPFNPAMAGYAVLLISFPKQMIAWLPPEGLSSVTLTIPETVDIMLLEKFPRDLGFDTMTMATPLDFAKTQLGLGMTIDEIKLGPVFGLLAGRGWDWVAFAYLLGGLWLLARRVIAWQIPVGLLSGVLLPALVFFLIDSASYLSPSFHLFGGATMLGAFFVATDPVTAAATEKGRFIYGLLTGVLIYMIRTFGGYPDGVAFAVLLMNLAAPTIDHCMRPPRVNN